MLYAVRRMDGCDIDRPGGGVDHGVDQDWFGTYWQRKSGCGPSTASNMLRYLGGRESLPWPVRSQADMVALMHRVWQHVTPGMFGLNSPHRFQQGMEQLLGLAGSALTCQVLEVPKERDQRPDSQAVADFIAAGLQQDMPVAFLNLHNGSLPHLERWHWVTLLKLDTRQGAMTATAVDNGRLLQLNLDAWLHSTALGGGFVRCG